MTLCPNSPYRIHTISKHPILNDDIYQGPWLWNTADCKYHNSFHTHLLIFVHYIPWSYTYMQIYFTPLD